MVQTFYLSVRQACRVLSLSRTVYHYRPDMLRDEPVILIDSQGSRSVMSELIILAATQEMIGMVRPVLPDVREFMRGTIALMEELLPYAAFGISLPQIRMLVNCMDYTVLARNTVEQLETIIAGRDYSPQADKIIMSLLQTRIHDLDVYKQGHASGQPAHRLETCTSRKSDSAFTSMYQLACELFPEWEPLFDAYAAMMTGGAHG